MYLEEKLQLFTRKKQSREESKYLQCDKSFTTPRDLDSKYNWQQNNDHMGFLMKNENNEGSFMVYAPKYNQLVSQSASQTVNLFYNIKVNLINTVRVSF